MPIGGFTTYDDEARRQSIGRTWTHDEFLLQEAIRVAQIRAGKKLFRKMKAKEKRAEEAQKRKDAKAREEKAARARAQKKAAQARENTKLRVGQSLAKTQKKRQDDKFVSLPSGLTLSQSALAEARQRANSQFGGGPKKANTKNQKGKNTAPTIMDSIANFLFNGDTAKGVKRPSPATPRRTSLAYRAFCLC
ncbi:hypothetical protein E4U60_004405 [Claviceps pazoutovae]|uniref:Uncharacterized protein n=1 Tax=Claviceps pazoutovae TaxID=1649127 RepID=A0A9P7M975_9HYPO|nr:hypothetical protein E4U60_004405 [Claviceps pazoutovae]